MEYLVQEALAEWQIYNIDASDDNYMTEGDMKDSIEYIIKKICLQMTDNIRDILSVGFPMGTEEEIIESIKNKAKIVVLNYTIQQNKPQEHYEVLQNINAFN